ncbi:MAG: dTMP kinase [Chloroflexota bacterium]
MPLFMTFEGGEGSGKSIQTRALYCRLVRRGIPALLTHEPGGTPFGERVGRWLKWARQVEISPLAELMLFNASRAQLVREVIRPGLDSGKVVICDRWVDSTTAYQSYGRGLDLATVETVNNVGTQGLKPSLTVLLDIAVEAGLARKQGERADRFEQEDLLFHRRVREGYLKLAASGPERWRVIDAARPRKEIGEIIWQRVEGLLSAGKG